jgi:hypothetical protein
MVDDMLERRCSYCKLVLAKIDQLGKDGDRTDDRAVKLEIRVAALETKLEVLAKEVQIKAGVWGVIGALVVIIFAWFVRANIL